MEYRKTNPVMYQKDNEKELSTDIYYNRDKLQNITLSERCQT